MPATAHHHLTEPCLKKQTKKKFNKKVVKIFKHSKSQVDQQNVVSTQLWWGAKKGGRMIKVSIWSFYLRDRFPGGGAVRTPPTEGPDGERKGAWSLGVTDARNCVGAVNWLPLFWWQTMSNWAPHPKPPRLAAPQWPAGPKPHFRRLTFWNHHNHLSDPKQRIMNGLLAESLKAATCTTQINTQTRQMKWWHMIEAVQCFDCKYRHYQWR